MSRKKGLKFKTIGSAQLSIEVPLEELDGCKLVSQSSEKASLVLKPMQTIKIFEYAP